MIEYTSENALTASVCEDNRVPHNLFITTCPASFNL